MGKYEATSTPILTNKLYDALVWVAQVFLPAAAVFYTSLGSIWGLPNVVAVVATITATDLFLGGLLKISKKRYDKNFVGKGELNINLENDDPIKLSLDEDLNSLVGKREVTLKVQNPA